VTLSRCAWCGTRFKGNEGPGRPRLYCRRSCRQRDYEARLRAAELGVGERELVVTRQQLEEIRDRVFVLSCAIQDWDQAEASDRRRTLNEVIAAAREIVS
jgi:hypothetical protein